MAFCGNSTFWNWNVSVTSSWPRLPQCFQSTVLVYIPAGFLFFSSTAYLPYLARLPATHHPINTPLCVSKTIISVALISLAIAAVITEVFTSYNYLHSPMEEFYPVTSARYVAKAVEVLCYATTVFLVQLEKQRSVITSGVLFIYWLLLVVCDVIPMVTFFEIKMYSVGPARFTLFVTTMTLIGAQLILNCFADTKISKSHQYRSENNCAELKASFLSRLVFFWMSRLLYKGYKRPLQAVDVWTLKPTDSCKRVLVRFETARHYPHKNSRHIQRSLRHDGKRCIRHHCSCSTEDVFSNSSNSAFTGERMPLLSSTSLKEEGEVSNLKSIKDTGLINILIKAFGWRVFLSYLCKFVSDSLQFVSPFLLKELIDYVILRNKQGINSDVSWHGYVLVGAMLVTSWLTTIFYHQHFQLAMTSGMTMKTALMAAIYKKSLRLANNHEQFGSSGKVVNLMSVDSQRVQEMMSYTWMVWSIPYQMALAVFLLWDTMGVSVLAGVGLLMLFIPINALIAYHQQRLQRVNLEWKDKRIKIIGEVISGIKVLKLYAWEDVFLHQIQELRAQEVSVLTKIAWLSAGATFMWTCAPYLLCLVSFGTYILTSPGSVLTAPVAFITLALFNILQFPVAFIPECVNSTSQAFVALRRIQDFLSLRELERDNGYFSSYGTVNSGSPSANIAVGIDKGLFAWDTNDSFRLRSVNLQMAWRSLTAVVGCVGSGKSSLLSCILGEMEQVQGKILVQGSTAYVPQSAWIQNATLQQNILFGAGLQVRRYKAVIRACALEKDLNSLPGKDHTEIGEKGVNLSGGQRQRVSLARALYSDADIYLFDDPLSAVDSEVGKHIFKRAISNKSFLRDKTRIMATHSIQWLPLVDHIIFIQAGRIAESGSYRELTSKDGLLTQFLRSEISKESDEEWMAQDEDVRNMKTMIRDHIEAITSCSESATSGDEIKRGHLTQRMERMCTLESSQGAVVNSSGPAKSQQAEIQLSSNHHNKPSRLTDLENSEDGNVKLRVFGLYCKKIGYCFSGLILALFTAYQVSSVSANLWLAKWTSDRTFLSANISIAQIKTQNMDYLMTYGLLGVCQVASLCIYAFLVSYRMVTASALMHNAMLFRILGAPMSFFVTTPTGRILNRFSRDVENMDNELPQVLLMFIMCIFSVMSTFVVISIKAVLFTAMIIPLVLMYWTLQRFFVCTSRQLKRLEAVSRSPIFSQFSETLSGCHIIRAFARSRHFESEFGQKMNKNIVFYFAAISANRWLGVWIEFISSLVVSASSIFLLIKPGVDGATMGLTITYALQITQALKWIVRSLSDIETNAVSLERVHEYTKLSQEAPRLTDTGVPPKWPNRGEIIFNKVTTRYRQDLDPVLQDVSFVIHSGEKIGIVGRTGAGKSSLTLALFRILELEKGDITLDNVNIKHIGLSTLRSSIAILPQDPVLISGTLRMNLDPRGHHTDKEIWKALTLARLRDLILEFEEGIDMEVGENGSKFSMGQRQLICLARALLKQTSILVMDEPTSSVDPETDVMVQRTITKAFKGCTTIIIAHRISTIMNCDRVMVLDGGQVAEFDRPLVLLKNTRSHFFSLARACGL